MNKHFISVLGTGRYSDAVYCFQGEKYQTAYIQKAVLKLILKEWKSGDRITIFVTKEAKERNYEGLYESLKEEYGVYLDEVEKTIIPLGANEEELWEIFQKMYDCIGEEEEIYLDITHSLRNIPVQMLAVMAFARTLKNVVIKGIYYGAFEARKQNEEGIEETPVFDLITFLDILDWSQAANSFVKYGNSDGIAELYKEQKTRLDSKKPELNKLVQELQNITHGLETSRGYYNFKNPNQTNKGKSILDSYLQYRETYDIMKVKDGKVSEGKKRQMDSIKPLGKLLDIINEKVAAFDVEDNLALGLAAVKWAIENRRTQQGFTALEETLKTYLCRYYGLDEEKEKYRDGICKSVCNKLSATMKNKGNSLNVKIREEAYEEWTQETAYNLKTEEELQTAYRIMIEVPEEIVDIGREISRCRNSMNHFGYSNIGSYDSRKLEENLKKYYKIFLECIQQMEGERNGAVIE
ncbi:MAG: TIGR02221 family CRISPR-associated protein [Lachnospiraceae bacterium]